MDRTPTLSSLRWIDIARLWSKINIPDAPRHEDMCWEWQGSRVRGYGQIKIQGQPHRAHMLTLLLAKGVPLVTGMIVCHHCDNPPCCNPVHLYWGTGKTNSQDMSQRHSRYIAFRVKREARKNGVNFTAGGTWRKGWRLKSKGVWIRPDGSLYETGKLQCSLTNTEI